MYQCLLDWLCLIQLLIEFIIFSRPRMFSRKLAKIRVQGNINSNLKYQIFKAIQKLNLRKYYGLAFIINSNGGTHQIAKEVSSRLITLRDDEHHERIPIYCFAQEFCLGHANLLLTSGTKAFASKFSIVGQFGKPYLPFDMTKMLNKINFEQVRITEMENNQIRYSRLPIIDITNQRLKQDVYNLQIKQLRQIVIRNRLAQIRARNQTEQSIDQMLVQKRVININDAAKNGLIDQISTFDLFVQKYFGRVKVEELNLGFSSRMGNFVYERFSHLFNRE